MPTMRDVAARAGVSAKTVSRVFNNDPHVHPDTRTRVEEALVELNYVPNTLATTFRTGRAAVIGIAVPSLADPFFATIVAAVDDEAKRHDHSSFVTSLGVDSAREPLLVETLLRRGLTGLVLAPISTDHRYLERWLHSVPTVFVDRPPVGITVDSFTEDDAEGAYLATSHLIGHGHRRILFLGDDLSTTTTAGRLAGYRRALEEHRIGYDGQLVMAGSTDNDSGELLGRVVRESAATAVFSSDARTSITSMPALKRLGTALVCFGDFSMADMLTPPVTVIDQDPDTLGRLATRRLFDRLAHPNRRLRRKTVLPVRLIERESGFHIPRGLIPVSA